MEATTTPIKVKSLDHVTLVVKDLDSSREFYVDKLGMAEVARPGLPFGGLWFQAGSTQIHLIEEHDQSGPAGWAAELTKRNSRNHHFAFLVDDAHQAAARIRQLGLPLVSDARKRPDGAIQVFVCDPDGYVVELCSLPG